ncbi:CocE/NonD family hydrolase [Nocardia transvalensis]|uniref:CocE/NonD family hydrolase n=1 Tax=Nocardia transvalensis TaxID=37333 RepID=UPI00189420F8|nr:CocE/NonD family hydrolase [Nocardia transvalensis]MBF6331713.1 CocE/NonD family hydrolase [Nocardia transvalensis]
MIHGRRWGLVGLAEMGLTVVSALVAMGLIVATAVPATDVAAAPLFGAAPTAPPGIGIPAGYTPPPPTYGIGLDVGQVVPLADGTQLTATVRYPTDPVTGQRAPGPFPVIVDYTTYIGLNGVITSVVTGAVRGALDALHVQLPDNVADLDRIVQQAMSTQDELVRRGYIEVIADVRGTGSSTGQWDPASPRDGQDGNQLVDWAAKLPGSNGKVGMFGYSFPGVSGMLTAQHSRPDTPLKAMMMYTIPNDVFKHVASHDGMFSPILLTAIIPMIQVMGVIGPILNLPLTPQVAVQALIDHLQGALASPDTPLAKLVEGYGNGTYGHKDQWWSARDFGPNMRTLVDNGIATYFVDGIWDLYQDGAFQNYAQLQNLAAGRPQYGPMDPDAPTDPRFQLLMGPWYHVGMGAGPYARMDTDPVTIAWFDHWLKGIDNGVDKTPDTLHLIDQTGAGANTTAYPFAPARPTTYRLGAGTLGGEPTGGPDRLAYSPVQNPCNRDNFEQWTAGLLQLALNLLHVNDPCAAGELGPQSGIAYTGDPVAEPTMVAGPGSLHTYISSTVDEAALQVHLDDVAPDGSAAEITGGAQLGTLRTLDEAKTWRTADGTVYSPEHNLSSADITPMRPGEVVELHIRLRPTYYRLEAGHRLRVRVTTGNFPSTLAPLPEIPKLLGSSVDILHDAEHPSSLTVPLAPASALHP